MVKSLRGRLLRRLVTIVLSAALAACTGDARPVFFSGPILEGTGPQGVIALDGAVTNAKDTEAGYVQVTFLLYGDSGKVLETLTDLVEGTGALGFLAPGEEGTFFLVGETTAERIARIEYVLSYDETSTAPAVLR